jgi:transaldolase
MLEDSLKNMPKKVGELRIKIFADGAEKANIVELASKSFIKGFTTNPTLMRKAGITDYVAFAKDILPIVHNLPISFEVFSDDFTEMERQARIINSWGSNVYVKIPITNTKKESSFDLIKKLAAEGIKMNITAILTLEQVQHILPALVPTVPTVISVFAGRVADTGIDPVPLMRACKELLVVTPNYELLWASPRELFNIYQAEEVGADIITVTPEVLKKTEKVGYDLTELSLDTVKMFYDDGQKVGYTLY